MADLKMAEALKAQIDDQMEKLQATVKVLYNQLELAHQEIDWRIEESAKAGRQSSYEIERLTKANKYVADEYDKLLKSANG